MVDLPDLEAWAIFAKVAQSGSFSRTGAGLGLAVQPEFTVWEDMAAGRLEQVLTEWSLRCYSIVTATLIR